MSPALPPAAGEPSAVPTPTTSTAHRVVLLDRDGTLVVDRHYLSDPGGLEFLPGAPEGLRRLHERGYRLVIISNQSGVGRGLLSLQQLRAVNARLAEMVRSIGAQLAGVYCCPHRPEEGCPCRKPGTLLVEQAARELGFDPRAAFVVGDKASDVELGRRLGAVSILIGSLALPGTFPDHVVPDLREAACLIEKLESCQHRQLG